MAENPISVKTIKELVYEYLKEQIRKKEILPGESINLDKTAKKLGVSRTPLREALIKLESEGFVKIIPHKGIFVNKLTKKDIKNFYQIVGALEAEAIIIAYPKLKDYHITLLKEFTEKMKEAYRIKDYPLYHTNNFKFHDLFPTLAENEYLKEIVDNIKKRLYDFTISMEGMEEWGKISVEDHETFIKLLQDGKATEAADFWKNVHWSFERQEKFINMYYFLEE